MISAVTSLKRVGIVVIDEVELLMDQTQIVEELCRRMPGDRQTVVFASTNKYTIMNDLIEKVRTLSGPTRLACHMLHAAADARCISGYAVATG